MTVCWEDWLRAGLLLTAGLVACGCSPAAPPAAPGTQPSAATNSPPPNEPPAAAPEQPAVPEPGPAAPPTTVVVPSEESLESPAPATLPPTAPMAPAPEAPPAIEVAEGTPPAAAAPENPAPAPARPPIFVDWPQPDFVLVITGRQNGYIEPCGCTGLANQKGGLARRFTFLQDLKARGWNPIAVDLGNQVRRFGRQQEIKFQRTTSALKKLEYAAIAYGPDDLRLSETELFAAAAGDDGVPAPFTAANASILGEATRYRVAQAGGAKVGIAAILGEGERKKVVNDAIESVAAESALGEVAPQLAAAGCRAQVLLAQASADETIRLVQKFPQFTVAVTPDGGDEPPAALEYVDGTKTIHVRLGNKGMYAVVLGFYAQDAANPVRYQRVPLDDRWADAPEMLKLLASYQQELEALGLDELGLRPTPHPSEKRFVGAKTCGECHTKAYAIWEKTPHAHATESLIHPPERTPISRVHDPECLSCHVTGWNPQEFYPYASGYLDLKKSLELHGSSCENCHGPGSAHVAAENGEGNPTEAQIAQLRASMRLPLAGGKAEQKCLQCHDLDNSPAFHKPGAFEKYWKRVEHWGKD